MRLADVTDLATYVKESPRFWLLFYKVPSALGLTEWAGFRRWARKNHPIQYFFREMVTARVRRWFSIRQMRKWARSDPPSNVLVLPSSEYDNYHSHQALVEQSLKLIFDRYIQTRPFEHSDWTGSEEMADKIHQIQAYYAVERPKIEREIEALEKEYDAQRRGLSFHERVHGEEAPAPQSVDSQLEELDREMTPEALSAMDAMHAREQHLHDRDTVFLQMIVEVRSFLW